MAPTVLGKVSLGYQLVWNRLRALCGVQLFIGADASAAVDATQLLAALHALWSAQAPQLMLSVPSAPLLADLLDQADADSPWLEVPEAQLREPTLLQRVHQAHQRGARLIWRGEPGARPGASLAPGFLRPLVTLSAEQALAALRLTLRKPSAADARPKNHAGSPVRAEHIYAAVASRALAQHCLDEQGAWGLAGWPLEDVLHGYRHRRIQPGHTAVVALMAAIDADDPVDVIEQLLSEEPILAYHFLRYANSAALGRHKEIDSLRRALMVLGLSSLRSWLQGQLPQTSNDLNLQPVRATLVLRARLMAQLLDAGDGEDLRREVFLCGLLSQMDLLLGEPLQEVLARLPLSRRITAAILSQSGPYLPYLEVASALESADAGASRALCEHHQMDLAEVNLALLHTLSPPLTGRHASW